jgi:hypothetical protein
MLVLPPLSVPLSTSFIEQPERAPSHPETETKTEADTADRRNQKAIYNT